MWNKHKNLEDFRLKTLDIIETNILEKNIFSGTTIRFFVDREEGGGYYTPLQIPP